MDDFQIRLSIRLVHIPYLRASTLSRMKTSPQRDSSRESMGGDIPSACPCGVYRETGMIDTNSNIGVLTSALSLAGGTLPYVLTRYP